jgi:hypothetical protein
VELTYRQLEAILAAYMAVHPDKIGTFRSRLKQLQRLEFPAGVNIGRGVRMTYTASHLLQLAVAFELIGTGLAAKAATDLVNAFWDRFEAAFGRAQEMLLFGDDAATFVQIESRPPVPSDVDADQIVSVHDLTSLTRVLSWPYAKPSRAAMQVIRADHLLSRINRFASDVGQVADPQFAKELIQWAKARRDHHPSWDYSDGGPEIQF